MALPGIQHPGQTAAQWARDGDIAIVEEFQAALAAGTVEAASLFIARHPEHRLAAHLRETVLTRTGDAPEATGETG